MKKVLNLSLALLAILTFASCQKDGKVPVSFNYTGQKVTVDVPITLTTELDICKNLYFNVDSLASVYEFDLDAVESIIVKSITLRMVDSTTTFEPVTMSIVERFTAKVENGSRDLFVNHEVPNTEVEEITIDTKDVDIKDLAAGSKNFNVCFNGTLRKPLDHAVRVEITAKYAVKASLTKKK
jgi:hypothetical protein